MEIVGISKNRKEQDLSDGKEEEEGEVGNGISHGVSAHHPIDATLNKNNGMRSSHPESPRNFVVITSHILRVFFMKVRKKTLLYL